MRWPSGPPSHCSTCIYEMGWQGTNSAGMAATGNDTNVLRTIFRGCNWDAVTSSNDNGSNDQTGTRNEASEAPSGIANFPNTAMADCAHVPSSLYLSAKPSWVGTLAWPLIGPDVSSSTITSLTGGHANKIPSRVCFDAATNDAGYGSSSPRVKAGVASACGVP